MKLTLNQKKYTCKFGIDNEYERLLQAKTNIYQKSDIQMETNENVNELTINKNTQLKMKRN